MVAHVPDMFRPRIRVEYPPDNKQIFEEWFFENVKDIPGDRVYLPVFWCSFSVNNDYGKGRKMADLQAFIDGLDRSKKYFTITQYDDGPLVDFKDLDIKVFGSGGGRIDCPIPLVCMPHPYSGQHGTYTGRIKKPSERHYLASFVGSITHPIRQRMVDVINSLPREYRDRYYIRTDHQPIQKFCEVMADSVFALCPRGYGKTSFRICEALQFGTIPIYISDEFIYPFDGIFHNPCIKFDEIETINEVLNDRYKYADLNLWQDQNEKIYNGGYTYGSLKETILEWLKRL